MKSKKYKTLAMLFAFMIVAVLSLIYLKPLISANAVSEEKCSSFQGAQGGDCWHALAHQVLDRAYCLKIMDNETRGHCLEHIPE